MFVSVTYTIVTPSDVAALKRTSQSLIPLKANANLAQKFFFVLNGVSIEALSDSFNLFSNNLCEVSVFTISSSLVVPLPSAVSSFKEFIKSTSFDYILRVDPGDSLDPCFFNSIPDNQFDIGIPTYHMFNDADTLLSVLDAHDVMHISDGFVLSEFHGAGTVFSRNIFLNTPSFPDSLSAQDGYWFWLNNLSANYTFLPESVYNYIKSDQSLSGNTLRLLENRLLCLRSFLSNSLPTKFSLKLLFVTVLPAPDSIESIILKRKLPSIFFSPALLTELLQDLFPVTVKSVAILNSDTFSPHSDLSFDCPSIYYPFSDDPLADIFVKLLPSDSDYFIYFNPRYPFSTLNELTVLLLQQIALQSECSVAIKKREHLSSYGYSSVSISSMRQLRLSEIQSKRQSGIISVKPSSLLNSLTLLTSKVSLSIGSNEGTIRIDDLATWTTLINSLS